MNEERNLSFDITGAQTLPAIGCSQYMLTWQGLFLHGFNLSNNDSQDYYLQNTSFQSCKVMPGSPMYYDNLGRRWKGILSEIFTVRFQQFKGIFLEVSLHVHFIQGAMTRLSGPGFSVTNVVLYSVYMICNLIYLSIIYNLRFPS